MPNMSDDELRRLLQESKTIAIIGAKDKEGHPVDAVGRHLISAGYTVYPVHPARKEVWGLKAYPTMLDVPGPIDIVDLFRAPRYCPDHAREALKLSPPPKVFWMQVGISSPEAEEILRDSPIRIIDNACLMVVHRMLLR